MSLGGGGGTQPVRRLPEQTACAGAAGADPTTGTLQRNNPCQCPRPSRGKASILPSKWPLFLPGSPPPPPPPSPREAPDARSPSPPPRHRLRRHRRCPPGRALLGGGERARHRPRRPFPPRPSAAASTQRAPAAGLPQPPRRPGGCRGGWVGCGELPGLGGSPAGSSPRGQRGGTTTPRAGHLPPLHPTQGRWERLGERASIAPSRSVGVFHSEGPPSAPSLICPARCCRL